ncbi:MAG: hypothetical protein JSV91_08705 [Phycisphaerales bacterium]|nr:MAG: hypothetical protein JSV91_08705 [Phycisphaerales bacterium]
MRLSRVLLWCLAGAVVFSIVVPTLVAFTAARNWVDPENLVLLGINIVLFTGAALCCAIIMERGRAVPWMRSAIVASAFCGAGWSLALFLSTGSNEWLWGLLLIWPTVWAGLMLVIGILLLPRDRGGWWRWMRLATIGITSVLAVYICLAATIFNIAYKFGLFWNEVFIQSMFWLTIVALVSWLFFRIKPPRQALPRRLIMICIPFLVLLAMLVLVLCRSGVIDFTEHWMPDQRDEDIAARIGVALALLAGGGMFACLLTIWIPGLTGRPQPVDHVREFALRCPRCGEEQTARTGAYTCRRCALAIKVDLL